MQRLQTLRLHASKLFGEGGGGGGGQGDRAVMWWVIVLVVIALIAVLVLGCGLEASNAICVHIGHAQNCTKTETTKA